MISQCIWGLGWALASGADVAWLTDELAAGSTADRAIVAQARWELTGGPLGMVAFATLAALTSLSVGIVASGVGMAILGLAVSRWPEHGFARASRDAPLVRTAVRKFGGALAVVRDDAVVRTTFLATALLFGGVQTLGRLREQRLLGLGMPTHPDPVVWFAGLGVLAFALGALAHRRLERTIGGASAPRAAYALAAVTGAVALAVVANVANIVAAGAGVVVVMGIADPVARTAASVVVNRRTTGPVRATVQSLLWQSGHVGVVVFGPALAGVAATSASASLTIAAVLLVVAAALVARPHLRT